MILAVTGVRIVGSGALNTWFLASSPDVDQLVDFPPRQVEVPDAEIRSLGDLERVLERREE